MGFLRDLQRQVNESSSLLTPRTGHGYTADGYSYGEDDGGVLGDNHFAADILRPMTATPKRAPFAASRGADEPGGAGERPTGSRYVLSGTQELEDDSNRTPIWLTALNIMNGVIGAGIISLPYAIYQAGLPSGIVLCVAVAVISNWTMRLLASLGQAHEAQTYEDLCHRAFGPVGYYTAVAMQGLFSFGAMCIYLVIVADLLPPAVDTWTHWSESQPSLARRDVVLVVPALALLLPLCLYRAYGQLAKYSIIKAVAIGFLVVTVVVLKFQVSVGSVRSDDWKYRDLHIDFFPAVGNVAFAFMCHHQTFLAWKSLKHATQRRFAISTHLALLGGLCLSITLGVTGYLTFFETTDADILFNYANYSDLKDSPLLNSARVLVSVSMLLTFPADLMVVRGTIENLLEARRKFARWRRLQSPVHDIRLLTALKVQEDEYKASGADAWRARDGCTRGILEHVAITLVLLAGALGIALGVTNLGVVTEVSGSVSAVFLAFVLPAAIRLRLGPTPDDTLPTFHRNNWASWFVLSFGLLAFVTSTGFTLVELITGKEFSLGAQR